MKTYTRTETITRPRLVIDYDTDAESPREWDNLGYFITTDTRYLPADDEPEILNIVMETQYEATDVDSHMAAIVKRMKEDRDEEVIYITPVMTYRHGSVVYRQGSDSGFDVSNNAFYIVTRKTADVLGTPTELFSKVIDGELEEYTNWCNGSVYRFQLMDENGDHEDSCGGFYELDHIKEHLGKEWQDEDMMDYLKT